MKTAGRCPPPAPLFHKSGGPLQVYMDTIQRIRRREALVQMAFIDELTQLPNRRLLLERLRQALQATKHHHRHGALLFIDLDHFKALNDTHGHDAGDELLYQVGQRLQRCVRSRDMVARLGGDEFVVLLDNLSEQAIEAMQQASQVAYKIMQQARPPYHLGRRTPLQVTMSIGISLFDQHTDGPAQVIAQADHAMYQAKAVGKNHVCHAPLALQDHTSALSIQPINPKIDNMRKI